MKFDLKHALVLAAGGFGVGMLGMLVLPNSRSFVKKARHLRKLDRVRELRPAPALGQEQTGKGKVASTPGNNGRKVSSMAIARPVVASQAESLVASFQDWEHFPLSETDCSDYAVDLILSSPRGDDPVLNKELDEAFQAIKTLHAKTNGWNGCIRSVELAFADIPAEEDQYTEYSEGVDKKLWVNGPNRQFEHIFRFIQSKSKYDVFFIMEPDSHPQSNFWLDDLMAEIRVKEPFAILGSEYDGSAWDEFANSVPLDLLHHINGNSVYNLTDPLLLNIISELEEESDTIYNAIPYDLRISQIILEAATGEPSTFMYDQTVDLPRKTEKFTQWWAEYELGFEAVKESTVISNQAALAYFPEDVEDASIVHGKNMFLPWDSQEHGTVSLVVKAHSGFDSNALSSVIGSNPPSLFSEVVILSDQELDEHAKNSFSNTAFPVTFQTRSSNVMDFCHVQVSSDWFLMTDEAYSIVDDMKLMVARDGSKRPLQGYVPSDAAWCNKSKACTDAVAKAQEIYPSMNSFVLWNDALYQNELREKFCNDWAKSHSDEAVKSDSVIATNYFSYLYANDYADSTYVLENKMALGTPSKVVKRSDVPRAITENIVDVAREDNGKSHPIFWHIPKSSGTTSKVILGTCLGLTLASNSGAQLEEAEATAAGLEYNGPETLGVVEKEGKRWPSHFVNVNLSTKEGIKQAKSLDLVGSNLAEVVLTPNFKMATEDLFSSDADRQGKAFAIFRNPIERANSLFHYLQVADWEKSYDPTLKDMTVEEWAKSGKAENNWIIRNLLGITDEAITRDHFELAKSVIDTKFLVGLTTELESSWERFRNYFGWTGSRFEEREPCVKGVFRRGGFNSNSHDALEEGGSEWNALLEINFWDVALYEHILEVYERQGALFGEEDAGSDAQYLRSTDFESELQSSAYTEFKRRMQAIVV